MDPPDAERFAILQARVDQLEQQVRELAGRSTGAAPLHTIDTTVPGEQASTDEVRELVLEGKKIDAVKLVRERTGLGLKDAKDFVDRL